MALTSREQAERRAWFFLKQLAQISDPRADSARRPPQRSYFVRRIAMSTLHQHTLSRRGFCLCCMGAATFAATGGWLSPSQAYAEARNIVDLIRDDAAKAPIKVHKL